MFSRRVFKSVFFTSGLIFAVSVAAYSHTIGLKQDNEKILSLTHAQVLFEKGVTMFQADNIEGAEKLFNQALQKLPEHAEASFYLGLCYYKKEDWEKSLEYFSAAKELFKRLQAIIYDYKLNKQSLSLEVAAWINNVEMMYDGYAVGGNSPRVSERTRQAEKMASAKHPDSPEENPPARYYFYCGNCYMKLQKYQESYEEFMKTVEIDPSYGEAHNNLAIICFMAEQYVDSWLHLQLAKRNGATVSPDFEKNLISCMQQ